MSSDETIRTESSSVKEQLLQEYFDLSKQLVEAKREGRDLVALKAEHKRVYERLQTVSPRKPSRLESNQTLQLHADLLTTPEELYDLRHGWDSMLQRTDNYSPFVTWEWWWPTLECFGDWLHPYVLVAKDQQGQLHGSLALATDQKSRGRRAWFIGSCCGPDPAYLSPPMANAEALGVLLRALSESPVRLLKWDQCPLDTRFAEILSAIAKEKWQFSLRIRRHYVHGELPPSWDEYVETVPSKNRRNLLRHQFERLEATWGPATCTVRTDASDETYALVEQLARFNIHRRIMLGDHSRWKDSVFQQCLSRVIGLFAERGWLRLLTVHVGDELGAVLLGWAYRGTFFAYQIGISPHHLETGIGHCVISHAIRSSIEEGLQRFEMLGQASQFKRSYFPGLTPAGTVVLGPDRSNYWFEVGQQALRTAVVARFREVQHGA